ncbi:MAG TPA: trehalose-phosphatase, partial [Actinomycetota bacterium]|nr:trehalose-phosphatase [Actinomycetota bacterium]
LDLVSQYAVVAVVTGRPSSEIRAFLPVGGLHLFGVYGLEGHPDARAMRPYRERLERIASSVPNAWVEDKGVSLTVHYRQAPDPDAAEIALGEAIGRFAAETGLIVLEGKRTLEVAAAQVPGKGEVVRSDAERRGLAACLYAGDDVADLDAFAGLDALAALGVETLKVAVRSAESPDAVLEAADTTVEGPAGLVSLLRELAD